MDVEESKELVVSENATKKEIHDFIEAREDQIIKCILNRNNPRAIANKLNVPSEFAVNVIAEYFKIRGLLSPSVNKRIRNRFVAMSSLELEEAKKEIYKIMKTADKDETRLKAAATLTRIIGDELNLLKELGVLTITPPKEKEGVIF